MTRFEARAWGLTCLLLMQACGTEELPVSITGPGKGEFRRVVPTDVRPVEQASVAPPAISGGTLLVSSDDKQAFASDPDRDRVSVIDLQNKALL